MALAVGHHAVKHSSTQDGSPEIGETAVLGS